jgi:hypothetical protein
MSQGSRRRYYVVAAAIAAAAALVNTVIQVTNPTFDSEFTTAVDWANEISATLMVAAALVAMWGLITEGIAPRVGGRIFMVGWGLLLIGLLPGFALGHSPEWFVVVGLPGNLLALVGMTMCAVYSWQHRTLPRPIAVLLPLSVLVGVGVAEWGGSIVIVIVWAAIAMRLSESAARPAPVGA